MLLTSKKKQLAELLRKQNSANTNETKSSDKIALVVCCIAIGLFTIFLIFVPVMKSKSKKKK